MPFVKEVLSLAYQNSPLRATSMIILLLLLMSLGIYGCLTEERGWWSAVLITIFDIMVIFFMAREERNKKNTKKEIRK